MPSLPKPRLRRPARGSLTPAATEQPERTPRVEVVESNGFRWVNSRPDAARGRMLKSISTSPPRPEDVLSRTQRPRSTNTRTNLIRPPLPGLRRTSGARKAGELEVSSDGTTSSRPETHAPAVETWSSAAPEEELSEQWFSRDPAFCLPASRGFDYDYERARSAQADAVVDEIFEGAPERSFATLEREGRSQLSQVIRPQRAVLVTRNQSSVPRNEGEELETTLTHRDAHDGSGTLLETTRRSSKRSRTRTVGDRPTRYRILASTRSASSSCATS